VTAVESSPRSSEPPADLQTVVLALGRAHSAGTANARHPLCPPERSAHANKRATLGLALVGLLVGGVLQLLMASPDTRDGPSEDTRAGVVFSSAQAGNCLAWPDGAPDKPSFVQCRDNHLFEVAKSVGMGNFGEPCQAAVSQYLGARYDPSSKFTISVLWAGDTGGAPPADRNLLCGLQLLGPDGKAMPFKGRVAEIDQSKVWPAGTCLGLDPATNRSTDIPADCATAHAVELTGAVNLADRFPGARPSGPDQDAFVKDECTQMTDAYLAPMSLQATGLALRYDSLSEESWSAGSHQVACRLESPGAQGLQPLVGSVRGQQAEAAQPPRPPEAAPPPPEPAPPEPAPVPLATQAQAPPSPPPAPTRPAPTSSAPTSSTPTASATPTTTSATTPPSPEPTPSESSGPPPGIIEIPGLAPITLPGYVPPDPAPGPMAPGPLPGPPPA
jgi:Septum formation